MPPHIPQTCSRPGLPSAFRPPPSPLLRQDSPHRRDHAGGIRLQRHVLLLAVLQVLDLADAGGRIRSRRRSAPCGSRGGRRISVAGRVSSRSGKTSTPMPAARNASRQPQVIVQPGPASKKGMNTGAGVETFSIMLQFFHRRQQPIQSQRGPDAGQLLVGDTARPGCRNARRSRRCRCPAGRRERSRRPCRCSSPARGRWKRRAARASAGTPAAATPSSSSFELATPSWPVSLPATSGSSCRSTSSLLPEISASREHLPGLLRGGAGGGGHLLGHALGADLAQLVQRRGARPSARSARSEPLQQAVEHHAVVQADGEVA